MNLPIYRAKKIDSDEYIKGYFDKGKLTNHKHLLCNGTNTEFIYDNTEDENGISHMGECFCFDCQEYGEQYNKDENLNTFISNYVRETFYIITEEKSIEIDPTTLSINFPDMLDSQGNKIFASLSEDGKGGDICYVKDFSYGDLQGVAKYDKHQFRIDRKGKAMGISLASRDIKVIGIQE